MKHQEHIVAVDANLVTNRQNGTVVVAIQNSDLVISIGSRLSQNVNVSCSICGSITKSEHLFGGR